MARDYKRLTRRARHLIRRLRRTKHAAVQRVTVHELGNEIHRRRFGRASRSATPTSAAAGHWRPLTHRAEAAPRPAAAREGVGGAAAPGQGDRPGTGEGPPADRPVAKAKAVRSARNAAKSTSRAVRRGARATGRGHTRHREGRTPGGAGGPPAPGPRQPRREGQGRPASGAATQEPRPARSPAARPAPARVPARPAEPPGLRAPPDRQARAHPPGSAPGPAEGRLRQCRGLPRRRLAGRRGHDPRRPAWPAGCLGPAAGAGSVLAWRRWGGNLRTLLQLAGELLKLRKHVRKIVSQGVPLSALSPCSPPKRRPAATTRTGSRSPTGRTRLPRAAGSAPSTGSAATGSGG